jgi:hypothetical protein
MLSNQVTRVTLGPPPGGCSSSQRMPAPNSASVVTSKPSVSR